MIRVWATISRDSQPMNSLPGGATQDKLPVSVEMLDLLGLVREVR